MTALSTESVAIFFSKMDNNTTDELKYREISGFWLSWLIINGPELGESWVEGCADLLTGISMGLQPTAPVTFSRVRDAVKEIYSNEHSQSKLLELCANDGSAGSNVLKKFGQLNGKVFAAHLAVVVVSLDASHKRDAQHANPDDLNILLREGMIVIGGLLEGRFGEPDAVAAFTLAEAMHNIVPDPVALGVAAGELTLFCTEYPNIAAILPQTCWWLDANNGGEQ